MMTVYGFFLAQMFTWVYLSQCNEFCGGLKCCSKAINNNTYIKKSILLRPQTPLWGQVLTVENNTCWFLRVISSAFTTGRSYNRVLQSKVDVCRLQAPSVYLLGPALIKTVSKYNIKTRLLLLLTGFYGINLHSTCFRSLRSHDTRFKH